MSYHSQENSAITDQSATRLDTGQRPRGKVRILASTERQAEVAAEQLGLAPNEWSLVRTIQDLMGLTPDAIIQVQPALLSPGVYEVELWDEVRQIEQRFGWRAKEVWT